MIRIRHRDGRLAAAPSDAVVEILDDQNRLVMVIFNSHIGVRCATAGDPVFNAHANIHKLIRSSVVVHEPLPHTATKI